MARSMHWFIPIAISMRFGSLYQSLWLVVLVGSIGSWQPCLADESPSSIVSLLASRCLECHGGSEPHAHLDLSYQRGLELGGESGPVIDPIRWDNSLLWQHVSDGTMPPKKKLTGAEKELIAHWIRSGATLPKEPIDRLRFSSEYRAGYDWWSLLPLATPAVPDVATSDWIKNPIDAFVLDRQSEHGVNHNPAATPRSLIKRLYYDLIGLPPTYQEIVAFEQNPSDEAYLAMVDRLLESPQFGERWARHWLDVVRFGESDGFERNYPRKSIWPYRDWVVQALNHDMPYDRFVQMQLVGDLIEPNEAGFAAAAFLVCGVHNTVVGSSDRMKRIAKQDELEEVIGTISQTFLGLTAQCARCHDHKFDPISSRTYYRLTSAIAGVEHGERDIPVPEIQQQLASLESKRSELERRLAEIHAIGRNGLTAREYPSVASASDPMPSSPSPLALWTFDDDWNDSVGALHATPRGNARLEAGGLVLDGNSYVATEMISSRIVAKTLMARVSINGFDQSGGGVLSLQTPGGEVFDAIVFAEREPKQWFAGSNGFVRSQSFHGEPEETPANASVHIAIRYAHDGMVQAFRNGKPYGAPYSTRVQPFESGHAQFLLGLRHSPPGGNRFFRGRIEEAAIYEDALSDQAIESIATLGSELVNESQMASVLSEPLRSERAALQHSIRSLQIEIQSLRPQSVRKLYSILPNAMPGITRVLQRGDVYAESDSVAAGGIDAIPMVDAEFRVPPDAPESERRLQLSRWIANRQNPLLSRVIVNRLWHYHFGIGIVDTPNDFGFNGGRPSDPQLLDWLASALVANDMRLRSIHRLIVLSNTYRQSTAPQPTNIERDANNRWLWRFPVRRLDAESIRDSMLKVSGKLNPTMGGPGFVDVDATENNGTMFYTPKDVTGAEFFRRTLYRFNPRCERNPILDTFDCPDPSATAPRRVSTTTPLQALSLLNNPFVLEMSRAVGDEVHSSITVEPGLARRHEVERMFQLVLLRLPSGQERTMSEAFVATYGLNGLARALLNSNEFLILD